MGSIGSTGRLAAFQSDVFTTGLDLTRGDLPRNLGVWKAADAATIRQGQLVSLNASQEVVIPTAGANILGFAKWNKLAGTGKALKVDEGISFTADTGTYTLARTSGVENLAIYSGTGRSGTRYIPPNSAGNNANRGYTFTAGGVVTKVADATSNPDIPLSTTVYATYSHDLVAADYDFQGRNFFNSNDDVTVAEGRIAVIQGPALLFTSEYVINDDWAINNLVYAVDEVAGSSQFAAADAGLVSNQQAGGAGEVVGRCMQVPNASDPFLGVLVTRL